MSLKAEFPKNYEAKTICCFVLDTSGSMGGNPIIELNNGLKEFHEEIHGDETTSQRLEIAIVTFDSNIKIIQEPALVEDCAAPTLTVDGTTRMVDGVREAITLVETRKQWYKQTGQQYLRPWIILITDGAPDSGQNIHGLAQEIQDGMNNKAFVFLAVGVKGADMNILQTISGSLKEKPVGPYMLKGLKFSEFFEWMSASMAIASSSAEGDKVSLPKPTWTDGFEI
ncbi:VWA domain-containing protein [Methylovulum psychrotolerans]|uniref:vWA domain-containing protein n=1 Tax=Methylovulum psychrotolerans TaxID=1704499 RepID=UPI001BFF87CE|nr:VWA domain-containing protein [Methylovulum psychrotolerans]MBT9096856.1 VWA domain-containing protein [Methylovulum psychrotolerans]